MECLPKEGEIDVTLVLTTTASLGPIALEQGQESCIPIAKAAKCSGVEIRRELFKEDRPELSALKAQIDNEQLMCVYSAPVELWLEDGALNEAKLNVIVPEALAVGAVYVKTSLGHYRPGHSDLESFKRWWGVHVPQESALKLTVENDQTLHGGNVKNLQRFYEDCREAGVPIGMTFDIGNWNWTGEQAVQAAEALGDYVVYIHFKHVEKVNGKLVTLPLPEEPESLWRNVLALLPQDVPRTIEFPINGEDRTGLLKHYAALIAEA